MAAFVVLGFLVLIAVLAPIYGADTRESRQGILSRTAPDAPARRSHSDNRYRRGRDGEENLDAGRARRPW